eukprot:2846757-Pyramimonas_sp.AAC.1
MLAGMIPEVPGVSPGSSWALDFNSLRGVVGSKKDSAFDLDGAPYSAHQKIGVIGGEITCDMFTDMMSLRTLPG